LPIQFSFNGFQANGYPIFGLLKACGFPVEEL